MPFRRPDGQYAYVRYVLLTAGAAQALGMHKVAGRWLDEDDRPDTLRVALVNEAYLHRIDAVGIGGAVRQGGSSAPPARIVGVVEDTYAVAGHAAEPTVFLTFSQVDAPSLARVRALAPLYAIVRGSEASAAVHDVLPRWAHVIAPSLAVAPARSLDGAARQATVASRRDSLAVRHVVLVGCRPRGGRSLFGAVGGSRHGTLGDRLAGGPRSHAKATPLSGRSARRMDRAYGHPAWVVRRARGSAVVVRRVPRIGCGGTGGDHGGRGRHACRHAFLSPCAGAARGGGGALVGLA